MSLKFCFILKAEKEFDNVTKNIDAQVKKEINGKYIIFVTFNIFIASV